MTSRAGSCAPGVVEVSGDTVSRRAGDRVGPVGQHGDAPGGPGRIGRLGPAWRRIDGALLPGW